MSAHTPEQMMAENHINQQGPKFAGAIAAERDRLKATNAKLIALLEQALKSLEHSFVLLDAPKDVAIREWVTIARAAIKAAKP